MDRQTWMLVRAYAPGLLLVIGAFVAMGIFAGWRDSQYFAGMWSTVRWIPVLLLCTGFALACAATFRLLRWNRARGPTCDRCGGPLGHERAGYASRGGAYRRCLACGDNVNHRHYEGSSDT